MFCYQCEQAAKGTGCTVVGVCGKDAQTAALQDLLIYATKGISHFANKAWQAGGKDLEINRFVLEALFSTVTNVNFDPDRLVTLLKKAAKMRDKSRALYNEVCGNEGRCSTCGCDKIPESALWELADTMDGLLKQAANVGIEKQKAALGDDRAGLQNLLMCGLQGTAAYADHAMILGKEDDAVYAFFFEALDFLNNPDPQVDDLLAMNLKCGEINLKVMGLLDAANTGAYGHPIPSPVRIHPLKGKAILVSGHDLKDLEMLLKQTEGKGINIYTHGEMLPAHGYPGLKQYKHLAGHYGGAWQDQRTEFDDFPGAILMTTNCIQKPKDSYQGRLFTCGLVAWPSVAHIHDRDYTPLIQAALAAEGFKEDGSDKTILVGFGHNAVLNVADKVIEAVKAGTIKHFFLIGGCDGAKSGRNYYTEFAQQVPKDCVILTLACGKFRFNKLDFGAINGIPRLLDCGQCNDAYSAIQIAVALANAFKCEVNELPLSLVLSWYEQKAVCILLTLLHLGIRNIRLGPTLPAFVTPAVLDVLVKKFNIMPITTPEQDLKTILEK